MDVYEREVKAIWDCYHEIAPILERWVYARSGNDIEAHRKALLNVNTHSYKLYDMAATYYHDTTWYPKN